MNVEKIKADFQIIGTSIKSLNIKNDFIFLDLTADDIEREIDVYYKIIGVSERENKPGGLLGLLEMTVAIDIHNDEQSMVVELVVEGGFCMDNSTNHEEMRRYLEVNGCASVYSIIRGIMSSITSQICTNGAITLPMINVFRLKEESEESNE